MRSRKFILGILLGGLLITQSEPLEISAINFETQEDKYMKLCASSSLTSSQQNTCKQFNNYLSKKNKELKKEIKQNESSIQTTQSSIDTIKEQINNLEHEISEKETEVQYFATMIQNKENEIKEKETEVKDRMYSMQTVNNSNSFVDYLFGANNFTDIFSRVSNINELTSYDNELIKEIYNNKKELEKQKNAISTAKKNLETQREQQYQLQIKYNDLLNKQNDTLTANKEKSEEITEAQKEIDNNLTAIFEAAQKYDKPSTSIPPINGPTTQTGLAIANKALSKQGSRYWWGAPGGGFGDGQGLDSPNTIYFDCSGLIAWAHRQAGVKIGRSTAAGYSRSGSGVSYSNLQIGDVITFNYGSGVAHIGIYIGVVNGQKSFVHASGKGSSTRGQYADQCVKVSSIEPGSYYYKYIYNCRRLY